MKLSLHIQAKRIARYLKGTREIKLRLKPTKISIGELQLESYSDAEFAANKSDRKSLTGGIARLNGMPVSWTAKKQGVTGHPEACTGDKEDGKKKRVLG
uniref:Uncharacterized protein n=1 Tax=Peronospora matthiolae TaxID=2874970 RepID=A0AAV1VLQ2_9STRA